MLPANVAAEAEEQDVKVIISGGTDIDETQDNPDGEPGDGQEGNDDNPDGEPGDGQEGNDDNPDGEPGDGQEGNDDNPDGEPGDGQDDNDDDPDPGLLPDSPFYFFKRFIENVKVWFTFDDG